MLTVLVQELSRGGPRRDAIIEIVHHESDRPGWYVVYRKSGLIARIGPDYGRFDSAEEALAELRRFYPLREFHAVLA